MRVLILAHFARGQSFGGSQRASAIAERLEERGAHITWQVIPGRTVSPLEKVKSSVTLRPIVQMFHDVPATIVGDYDAAIVEHSYMAHYLEDVQAPRGFVDFHNLEWVYLQEVARLSAGTQRGYRMWQAYLTRRAEKQVLRSGRTALFATREELTWARRAVPGAAALFAPNILPSADVAAARVIRSARRNASPAAKFLLYVGTLSYPPNAVSLQRFLDESWPAVRAALPDISLVIAGDASPSELSALRRRPGVKALGFVENIDPLLCEATAAVLPVSAGGGSSMRMLLYALAGIPVIATERAARSFEYLRPMIVDTNDQWVDAVAAIWNSRASHDAGEAIDRVEALHSDPDPWDTMFAALVGG